MRIYFGHARAVQRTVTQLLEEIPEAWSALYRQVQSWRSRLATADFSVVDGLIFLQQPSALQDPEVLLRLFHFEWPSTGSELSATTEYRIEQALPALASDAASGSRALAVFRGNLAATARRGGSARHAFAAAVDSAAAGIEGSSRPVWWCVTSIIGSP